MKPEKKNRKGLLRRWGLSVAAIAILGFVFYPYFRPALEVIYIRWCLLDAKSVELVHYNPYSAHVGHDLVYATKELKPEEYSMVAAAFPFCLDTDYSIGGFKKCLFDPHHRILITSRFGFTTLVRVCFLCDQVEVGDHAGPFESPPGWTAPLRKLFADEGMPFSPDRYGSDYRDDMQKNPLR